MSRLITVFGSPGSGKTTLALAMASRLALAKNNVVLVSSDKVVPNMRVLLPTVDTDKTRSMGALLMQSDLTQKLIAPKLVFHPESDFLACMALCSGDNPISYPPLFDPGKIMAFLNVLSGLADYVIVDGTSNPATDSVTLTALEACEDVICTLTPDRKGIEYLSAILAVLRDGKYKADRHMRVLSPVRPVNPIKELRGLIEDVRFSLPYSAEVEERMLSGRLMKDFGRLEGMIFESRVAHILEELR